MDSSSCSSEKYLGTTKTLFPMVLIIANGVFSTSATSLGLSVYWFAFEMVIGLTAVVKPPLIPATHNGRNTNSATTLTT